MIPAESARAFLAEPESRVDFALVAISLKALAMFSPVSARALVFAASSAGSAFESFRARALMLVSASATAPSIRGGYTSFDRMQFEQ